MKTKLGYQLFCSLCFCRKDFTLNTRNTRGYKCKITFDYSRGNNNKYFFVNWVVLIWYSLRAKIVQKQNFIKFKHFIHPYDSFIRFIFCQNPFIFQLFATYIGNFSWNFLHVFHLCFSFCKMCHNMHLIMVHKVLWCDFNDCKHAFDRRRESAWRSARMAMLSWTSCLVLAAPSAACLRIYRNSGWRHLGGGRHTGG